jgi:hypothetical protein
MSGDDEDKKNLAWAQLVGPAGQTALGSLCAVIQAIRPALSLTQSQIDRIAAAERALVTNLNAHEQMREFWEPGEWTGPCPNRRGTGANQFPRPSSR